MNMRLSAHQGAEVRPRRCGLSACQIVCVCVCVEREKTRIEPLSLPSSTYIYIQFRVGPFMHSCSKLSWAEENERWMTSLRPNGERRSGLDPPPVCPSWCSPHPLGFRLWQRRRRTCSVWFDAIDALRRSQKFTLSSNSCHSGLFNTINCQTH